MQVQILQIDDLSLLLPLGTYNSNQAVRPTMLLMASSPQRAVLTSLQSQMLQTDNLSMQFPSKIK